MLAIKGTDKYMKCRGFQYELDKTYKMVKGPVLCKQGFHACLNPYDVLKYYRNKDGNRFFVVELGGMIVDCDDFDTKVASNEITFLKEVTVDDFPQLFEEFLKDKERLAKLYYNEGFASVKLTEKHSFINTKGEYLSDQWFDFCYRFQQGFGCVRLNGEWNFINTKGEYLSDQWFVECSNFQEGFACVKLDGKWNFIKPNGEYLSEQWFEFCGSFVNCVANVKLNGKWAYINTKGELIL